MAGWRSIVGFFFGRFGVPPAAAVPGTITLTARLTTTITLSTRP